jgi:hypothetical protein
MPCNQSIYRYSSISATLQRFWKLKRSTIRTDSAYYLFGYPNTSSSGMNLGPKCDKKGREVSELAP